MDRLKKLARVQGGQGTGEDEVGDSGGPQSEVRWTEVLWGRKTVDQKSSDALEQKDVEHVLCARRTIYVCLPFFQLVQFIKRSQKMPDNSYSRTRHNNTTVSHTKSPSSGDKT